MVERLSTLMTRVEQARKVCEGWIFKSIRADLALKDFAWSTARKARLMKRRAILPARREDKPVVLPLPVPTPVELVNDPEPKGKGKAKGKEKEKKKSKAELIKEANAARLAANPVQTQVTPIVFERKEAGVLTPEKSHLSVK